MTNIVNLFALIIYLVKEFVFYIFYKLRNFSNRKIILVYGGN